MEIGGIRNRHKSGDHVLRTDSFRLAEVKMFASAYNNWSTSLRIAAHVEVKNNIARIILEQKTQTNLLKFLKEIQPYMKYKVLNEDRVVVDGEEIKGDLEADFKDYDF